MWQEGSSVQGEVWGGRVGFRCPSPFYGEGSLQLEEGLLGLSLRPGGTSAGSSSPKSEDAHRVRNRSLRAKFGPPPCARGVRNALHLGETEGCLEYASRLPFFPSLPWCLARTPPRPGAGT